MSGLRLESLAVGYRQPIVVGINLHVLPGEVVAILGASGSGKSTLLSTIAGTLSPLAGRVLLDDQDITNSPVNRRRIGIVFQEPLLFGHLDVLANISYGPRRQGVSRAAAAERARSLLEWIGLPELAHRPVGQLSGGQARRVALARALAAEPAAVLLDEPFSALDADLRTRLAREMAGRLRERGICTIHVTHDLQEAKAIADRIWTVQPGVPRGPGSLAEEPDS